MDIDDDTSFPIGHILANPLKSYFQKQRLVISITKQETPRRPVSLPWKRLKRFSELLYQTLQSKAYTIIVGPPAYTQVYMSHNHHGHLTSLIQVRSKYQSQDLKHTTSHGSYLVSGMNHQSLTPGQTSSPGLLYFYFSVPYKYKPSIWALHQQHPWSRILY